MVHRGNATFNPVLPDNLGAFTLPVTIVSCTSVKQQIHHNQHKKGGFIGDLHIFLLEDLKLLSWLSYLGCHSKDTEITTDGTDRTSK